MVEAKFEAALIKKLEAEGWTYRKDLSYVSIKVLEGHWREVLNENNAYKGIYPEEKDLKYNQYKRKLEVYRETQIYSDVRLYKKEKFEEKYINEYS